MNIIARVTKYKEESKAEVEVQIDEKVTGVCSLVWEPQDNCWVWSGPGVVFWGSDEIQKWVCPLPDDDYLQAIDAIREACTTAIEHYEVGEDLLFGMSADPTENPIETLFALIDEQAEGLDWRYELGAFRVEISDDTIATVTSTVKLSVFSEYDPNQERAKRVYRIARDKVARRAIDALTVKRDQPTCPRCKDKDVNCPLRHSGASK